MNRETKQRLRQVQLYKVGEKCRELGKYDETLRYHEECLEIGKRILPSNHSHIADSIRNSIQKSKKIRRSCEVSQTVTGNL